MLGSTFAKTLRLVPALIAMSLAFANEARAFNVRHHLELTDEELRRAGMTERPPIQIVQAANWNVDFDSVDPFSIATMLHFDNLDTVEKIVRRWDRINEAVDRIVDQLAAKNDRTGLLVFLGIVLHGVQDFYSHSSWAEMNWDGHGFAKHVIYEEVPRAKVLDILDGAGRHLRSGAYGHVLSSDDSGTPDIEHDLLNKDHAGKPRHELALEMARRATTRWIRHFRQRLEDGGKVTWYDLTYHRDDWIERSARRSLILAEDVSRRIGCWDASEPETTDQRIADELARDLPVGDAFDRLWHRLAELYVSGFAWVPASVSTPDDNFGRKRLAMSIALVNGFRAPHPAAADVGKTLWGQQRR